MLAGADGIVVVGEIAPAALSTTPDVGAAADVFVIDLDEGEATPVDIDELAPTTPAVLLAAHPADYAPALTEAGAPRAWLLKSATTEEIVAAVVAVHRGLLVIEPAVARATLAPRPAGAQRPGPEAEELVEPLTEREREVLALLALGLPNKGIALRLGISEHTVKYHVGAILAKLGATGRTEAVMLAARRGLLPL